MTNHTKNRKVRSRVMVLSIDGETTVHGKNTPAVHSAVVYAVKEPVKVVLRRKAEVTSCRRNSILDYCTTCIGATKESCSLQTVISSYLTSCVVPDRRAFVTATLNWLFESLKQRDKFISRINFGDAHTAKVIDPLTLCHEVKICFASATLHDMAYTRIPTTQDGLACRWLYSC
jgi:hypothetical protein